MNIVSVFFLDYNKEKQCIGLPKNSKILSVCVKKERVYISVEHDVNALVYRDYHSVEFAIFREGRHFYTNGYTFLGTVILEFGNSFFHVFYRDA